MRLTTILFSSILAMSSIAGESKTTQKVSATLSGTCEFVASDVIFGVYNTLDSVYNETHQSISLHCSKGVAYQIMTFAPGNPLIMENGEAATAMLSSTTPDKLYYQVFEEQSTYNGSNGNVWDEDMNDPAQAQYGTGKGITENISFKYRMLKNQNVTPGFYSATQIMKINF